MLERETWPCTSTVYLVLGSAVVGLLVGMTGMGGGALMTPMLVLLFGVAPSAAISSDLVAALFMKPAGVAIHWRRRTSRLHVVQATCAIGSVPAAFVGTFVMHLMGNSARRRAAASQIFLGPALVIGALSMTVAVVCWCATTTGDAPRGRCVPCPPCSSGVVGGFMVGLTSVGAGSLILVLLARASTRSSATTTSSAPTSPSPCRSPSAATRRARSLFGHVDFVAHDLDHHRRRAGGHRRGR